MTSKNEKIIKALEDKEYLSLISALKIKNEELLSLDILGQVINFLVKNNKNTLTQNALTSVLLEYDLENTSVQEFFKIHKNSIVHFFKKHKEGFNFNMADFILVDNQMDIDKKRKKLLFLKSLDLVPNWYKMTELMIFMPKSHIPLLIELDLPKDFRVKDQPFIHYLFNLLKAKESLTKLKLEEDIVKRKDDLGLFEIMDVFIKNGWDLQIKNKNGETFLHFIDAPDNKFFLKNKVNPNLVNKKQELPIVSCMKENNENTEKTIRNLIKYMKLYPLPSAQIYEENLKKIEQVINKQKNKKQFLEKIYFNLQYIAKKHSNYRIKML